jgi:8-oxo-dGTP diphosphatase
VTCTALLGDDHLMVEQLASMESRDPPRIPASVGALVFDARGRLLILKTTYKRRWSLPGGQVEANGESPWEACRRETLEECGLALDRGELVCVDFLPPKPARPGGLRFLFDCGRPGDERLREIRLQAEEIESHRFVAPGEAITLLTRPVGRRVAATLGAERCVYLEDGRPVHGLA